LLASGLSAVLLLELELLDCLVSTLNYGLRKKVSGEKTKKRRTHRKMLMPTVQAFLSNVAGENPRARVPLCGKKKKTEDDKETKKKRNMVPP